jgi:predicted adenylyl cyclase CyaB
MPSNVEIKAMLRNRAAAEAVAARLSDTTAERMDQEDVFFNSAGARLKLRILGPERGELIRYERPDVAQIRGSKYWIARTSDPEPLREILRQTLGITGVVRKARILYKVGQTRIHIDRVEGLGDFLELEVVLRPGQTEVEGRAIAESLLANFMIEEHELVGVAYVDLLARTEVTEPRKPVCPGAHSEL